MPNKKAFVFDTNFIIENLNLKEVVANLSEEFTVYVTQVSIDLFGKNIIPFASDKVTFSKIFDRVYKKIPPFLSADGASDKGFKDSLIWISLLDFFQTAGEDGGAFYRAIVGAV